MSRRLAVVLAEIFVAAQIGGCVQEICYAGCDDHYEHCHATCSSPDECEECEQDMYECIESCEEAFQVELFAEDE